MDKTTHDIFQLVYANLLTSALHRHGPNGIENERLSEEDIKHCFNMALKAAKYASIRIKKAE